MAITTTPISIEKEYIQNLLRNAFAKPKLDVTNRYKLPIINTVIASQYKLSITKNIND